MKSWNNKILILICLVVFAGLWIATLVQVFHAQHQMRLAAGILISIALLSTISIFIILGRRQLRLNTELARSEEKFRLLADFTTDWEYWIDPGQKIVYSSPSSLEITGYSQKEIMCDKDLIEMMVHSDDKAKFSNHRSLVRKEEDDNIQASENIEYRIITKAGEERWLNHVCRPVFVEGNLFRGRRVSSRDITPLKQTEEALRKNEELLHKVTDRIPGALFILKKTADGALLFSWASAGIKKLFGVELPEVIIDSDLILRFFHPDDIAAMKLKMDESAENMAPFTSEWRCLVASSGDYRWFKSDSTPHVGSDGTVVWYGYVSDIHDVKLIEEKLKKSMEELEHAVITDPLTGLPNRRYFFEKGKVEFFRAARYGRALAAIMMDIDHFKAINDSLGHAAGDVVLVQIADIMRECVRESDVIARYGGEEFVILLPETDRDGAMAIAERIRGMIEEASLATGNGEKVRITLSLGLAIMDEENIYPSLDKLLQQADMSLYSAKDTGRNRVVML